MKYQLWHVLDAHQVINYHREDALSPTLQQTVNISTLPHQTTNATLVKTLSIKTG